MRAYSLALLAALVLMPAGANAQPIEGFAPFKEHLEFLGYTVEEKDDDKRAVAKHNRNYDISIRTYLGGLLFSSFITMKKPLGDNRNAALEVANRLNADAQTVRYYIDKDGDLAIESVFLSAYDRGVFGRFMDHYNDISSQLSKLTETETALFD